MITPVNQHRTAHLQASFQQTWGYVRHELLYILWGVMEVALITPIALAFMPWAFAWPPEQVTLWLLLLLLIPFNMARVMTYLQVPLARQRQIMVIAAFLVILLALRTLLYDLQSIFDVSWLGEFFRNISEADNMLWQRDVTLFVVVGFTWWRGITMVTREPDIIRLGQRIRSGALYVAPFAIFAAYVNLEWSIAPYILLFFAAGLTAVALTRTEQVERAQRATVTSMTPRWFFVVLGVSLFTVFIAGFLAFAVKDVSLSDMGWLMILWLPLRFGGSSVMLTVAFLSSPFWTTLDRFLQWLIMFWNQAFRSIFTAAAPMEESDFRPPQDERMIELLTRPTGDALVNWRFFLLGFLILLFVLVIFALGRFYRRQRLELAGGRFSRGIGGQVEHLEPREKAGLGQRILQRLGLLRNWQTAVSIRRIYYQMEQAATAVGYPRGDSLTPYEYLSLLQQTWPDHGAETRLITEAFVRIRYGEYPETEAEFTEIENAWQRLKLARPHDAIQEE
ncbi:MAG: DUF4129 domain-containing protein [Chloroflexota bacterium]